MKKEKCLEKKGNDNDAGAQFGGRVSTFVVMAGKGVLQTVRSI